MQAKQVLIVGGGFAGVRAARLIARLPRTNVTLISNSDTFTYYPQMYHAATGGSRSETALPLADIFAGTSVKVLIESARSLDHAKHTLVTDKESHHYDELILALGSVTNYFGIKGLQEYSYDIKTNEGAAAFKHHLHQQLIDDGKTDLNYVVVGGGPTGVELAGSLGAYLERITKLHGITKPKYTVDLIEAAPRLLPRSPEKYAAKVDARLRALGVNVMTGAAVEGETATTLMVKGQPLQTETVVWTSGVANNPFFKANESEFKLAKNGRVEVNEFLEAHPHVYVIGDNALVQYGGLAETAVHQANYVASDIEGKLHASSRSAFIPREGASVIPVGSGWAAASWHRMNFYGSVGWLLRRAADLVAYRDIEPLSKAIKVWLSDFSHEDNCPICDKAQA